MENFDSSITELKSHLAETNGDLEELNSTLIRKVTTLIIALAFDLVIVENFLANRPTYRATYGNQRTYLPTYHLPINNWPTYTDTVL